MSSFVDGAISFLSIKDLELLVGMGVALSFTAIYLFFRIFIFRPVRKRKDE